MTNRERAMAVLHYEPYDRLPIVHFGWWGETVEKWVAEGHLTAEEAANCWDGTASDTLIGKRLGFDFNWSSAFGGDSGLRRRGPFLSGRESAGLDVADAPARLCREAAVLGRSL